MINLWLLPVLLTILMIIFIISKVDSLGDLTWVEILGWVCFFIFSAGMFLFLFFNHLPIAKQTELIITNKNFEIIQQGQTYSGELNDITEVVEYSTGRLPWSSIAKWIVKTGDREIVISSLTISKSNFKRYFWNKTIDKTSLLPTL